MCKRDRLERGEADLLIAADFAVPRATIARPLLRERYVMAQRHGHPRGLAPPDLDAYCALRHVIVSGDGGGLRGFMDERLHALGRSRVVAVSVQQYHLAPLVLDATDYVCALPERFLLRFADRLDLLPLPIEVDGFTLSAAWHPRLHADPAHRWLRGALFAAVGARTEDGPDMAPARASSDGARARHAAGRARTTRRPPSRPRHRTTTRTRHERARHTRSGAPAPCAAQERRASAVAAPAAVTNTSPASS